MPNTDWSPNRSFDDALILFDSSTVLMDDPTALFDGYDPTLVQPKPTNWTPA